MLKKLLIFFFLQLSFFSVAQNVTLSSKAKISIFTCGRGEELYSTFGHTALRINDSISGIDVVYNYGAFDFRITNFYLKFVKGDLQYFMDATSYREFIYEYEYFNREVIEQTLNLTQKQKQNLFNKLQENFTSSDKFYTYKFIDRNCTTMVADKINETIGQKIINKVDDTSISYRKLLYPYFDNYFWYKLGINIIFGIKTDSKAEQLFLPNELLNSLDKATVNGKKLVLKKETILNGAKLESRFSFLNSIYFIITVLVLITLTRKVVVYKTYLFLCGFLGLFLCVVGLYSEHQEVLWNYNALLFNPLYLGIFFSKGELRKKLILTSGIMLLLYTLFLINKAHFTLMLPFIISTGIMLFFLYKKLLTSVK